MSVSGVGVLWVAVLLQYVVSRLSQRVNEVFVELVESLKGPR